jgi:hypothetical protein
VEQELAHAFLHRHLVEHAAQFDGVLDGQRLALFHLLGQRDTALGGLVLVLEVVLQELLELDQHGLEDTAAGVGVGLDDLHDALDLALQRVAHGAAGAVEAHHAGAHAVDQAARRVVDGGEEVGLGHRHTQHRHLQARKPNAHAGRDAVFGEDALEQQGHDLDGGALFGCGRGLLELLLALVQLFEHDRRGDQRLATRVVGATGAGGCRSCAVSMARARPADSAGPPRCSGCERVDEPKSGTCRPISRFKRPSTASACSRLRASGALRVIMRVSSATSVTAPVATAGPGAEEAALGPWCHPLPNPPGAATPPECPRRRCRSASPAGIGVGMRERRMKGRKSTSGSTPWLTSQRLVSW